MNKCCKSLLYKGLCLSKDISSYRVLSTMMNSYSALGQKRFYFPYEKKENDSKLLFDARTPTLLIHHQRNHLARNSKKSTSKSDTKKSNLSETNFQKELETDKEGIDHLFKPLTVNPILTVDKDNVGVQLGGNLTKCKKKKLYYHILFLIITRREKISMRIFFKLVYQIKNFFGNIS
jgi:hypothetical protein